MRARTIQLHGREILCTGDESLMCCTVEAHGQEVIAKGILHHEGMTWSMDHLDLCVPGNDESEQIVAPK